MNVRHVALVVAQELRDYRRARWLWRTLLLQPLLLLAPALVIGLVFNVESDESEAQRFTVAVRGERADTETLARALRTNGLDLRFAADPERLVVEERTDAGLVVPAGTERRFRDGERVELETLVFPLRDKSKTAAEVLSRTLAELGAETSAKRLASAGVPPDVVRPYQLDLTDLTRETARGARSLFAQSLPLMIGILLLGAVGAAESRIAGSRQKRTLEPNLVLPVSRTDLLVGISIAAGVISLLGAVLLLVPAVAITTLIVSRDSAGLDPLTVAAVVFLASILLVAVCVAIGVWFGTKAATAESGSKIAGAANVGLYAAVLALPFIPESMVERLLVMPFLGPLLLARVAVESGVGTEEVLRCVAGTAIASILLIRSAGRALDSERAVLRLSGT